MSKFVAEPEDFIFSSSKEIDEGKGTEEKRIEKCGGEGGTPGPCPEESGGGESKPKTPKKPSSPKPHLEATSTVLESARAGTLSMNDLDSFGASLRKLPPTKLAQVAVAVGLPKGTDRFEIVDHINELRIAAKRGNKTPTPASPASETESKPETPSPERTRENASRAASAFAQLDTGRNYVKITDLRREMADLSKEEFVAAVNHLRRNGFVGGALEGRHGATREELDTAIRDPRGPGQTDTLIGYLSRRNPTKKKKKR